MFKSIFQFLTVSCFATLSFFSAYSNPGKRHIINIETQNTSLIYMVEDSVIHKYYYGAKLQTPADYLNYKGNGAGDLLSAFAGGSTNEAALSVVHANGVLSTEFICINYSTTVIEDNISLTTIILKDRAYNFYATVYFKAYKKEDIIDTWINYRNEENGLVTLKSFASAYIPLHANNYFLTKFHGSWFGEMKMEEEKLPFGITTLQSIEGLRVTHHLSPSFTVSLNTPATEETGEVIGGTLAWSGSWKISFDKDWENRLNIIAGINNYQSEWALKNGEQLEGCHFLYTYSNTGKGTMSRNFHSWARKYSMQDGQQLRPVVLNSWEGNFFDFDETKIIKMIQDAAEMGVEMFVLDDGWFGSDKYQRDNDSKALGDWSVNKKRFPKGLEKTINEAKKRNIKFGIWIEPEMVNRESEIYEKHPEWVLKEADRTQHTGRNNYVLDLTNPAAVNYVIESVHKVIIQNAYISYVKWDCNSPVMNPYSPYLDKNSQQQFWYRYTKNLYGAFDSLTRLHPNIMFQVCASGGGRVEYGSLPYFHEFWASDNTDALQRVFIQHGYSYFFPANAMAAHVAKVPNGITQRITPLKYRFDVAMSGRMGIELLPTDLNKDELAFAKNAVATYKKIRPVVQQGNLFRLASPYEGKLSSLQYVDDKQEKAVVFVYQTQRMFGDYYSNITLKGLDPKKKYKVSEINQVESEQKKFTDEESVFSGEFLMNNGLHNVYWGKQDALSVNLMGEFASAVFLIEQTNN